MKKTIIPIVVAVVLIIIIGGVSIGVRLFEKYSYSRERADLNEYFAISSQEDVAIILGNEMIEETGKADRRYLLSGAALCSSIF